MSPDITMRDPIVALLIFWTIVAGLAFNWL